MVALVVVAFVVGAVGAGAGATAAGIDEATAGAAVVICFAVVVIAWSIELVEEDSILFDDKVNPFALPNVPPVPVCVLLRRHDAVLPKSPTLMKQAGVAVIA